MESLVFEFSLDASSLITGTATGYGATLTSTLPPAPEFDGGASGLAVVPEPASDGRAGDAAGLPADVIKSHGSASGATRSPGLG